MFFFEAIAKSICVQTCGAKVLTFSIFRYRFGAEPVHRERISATAKGDCDKAQRLEAEAQSVARQLAGDAAIVPWWEDSMTMARADDQLDLSATVAFYG